MPKYRRAGSYCTALGGRNMNLEEVKQFLEENKESEDVKAYLGELKQPTAEDVEGFLDSKDGQKLLQPRLDRNFSKGLETWKEKNLDQLVDDEVKKRNPDETEEQKRIRELEKAIEKSENEKKREKLMNKAVSHASEKGLPTDIVSFFIGDDEDTTIANLGTLEEKYNAAIEKAVNQKFKDNGTDFTRSNDKSKSSVNISELAKEANIRQ